VETTSSRDGTTIAFDRSGDGPPIILMGGALNDRQTTAPLAELLATRFTILNYDRRGRGGSTDTAPYAPLREIEDLDAVITAAGGSAYLFANCTGGFVAIAAAAQGLAITKLALYEPPYIADKRIVSSHDDSYRARLAQLLADGRRGDALEHFMINAAGIPPELAVKRRTLPIWPTLEALAPTLLYDAIVASDQNVPTDQLARITVPVLVMDGTNSSDVQRNAGRAIADTLTDARHVSLPGHSHKLVAEAVAPSLLEFFTV
jgi:pimeloyl-ACP methyl ester carboxylesterase